MLSPLKNLLPFEARQQAKFFLGSSTKKQLKKIRSVYGQSLNQNLKRRCDEYARDILGKRRYAEWLYIYCMITESFKEGWIPDDYYGEIVTPKIKGMYGDISELNALQSALFGREHIPDLAYQTNGILLDADYRPVKNIGERLNSTQLATQIVFKKDKSMQGRGVEILAPPYCDAKLRSLGDGVFQKHIDQHDFFKSFHRESVATLRMTTVIEHDGTASLRAAYLRLGIGHETHVQSVSHIRVPVCSSTGRLYEEGYTVHWERIRAHPSTGTTFEGKTIPNFGACVDLALELQSKVAFARCVGWDMALDKDGRPIVMEWNGAHNDIKFSEATTGPCFKDLGWESLWKT